MYIINVTEVDTGAQFQYSSSNTQYTLRSLHPYYTYEFVIEAVTVAPGPPTSAFSIQTSQDGKCHISYIVCGNTSPNMVQPLRERERIRCYK